MTVLANLIANWWLLVCRRKEVVQLVAPSVVEALVLMVAALLWGSKDLLARVKGTHQLLDMGKEAGCLVLEGTLFPITYISIVHAEDCKTLCMYSYSFSLSCSNAIAII